MATVVSVINLKGGVGKSQLTVALAEFLALEHNKRILVIDLDPQTNATVMLMPEEDWRTRNDQGRTIAQLFRDRLESTSVFSLDDALVTNASNIARWTSRVHLLPSSLDLIGLQDRLVLIQAGTFFLGSPVTVLSNVVQPILDSYDFILLDCPPNLGITTLNGLYISQSFLIPVIPDILSTYGIPQILDRVSAFNAEGSLNIRPLGIVVSRYRAQAWALHDVIIRNLVAQHQQGRLPRIFQTRIPESKTVAEAAEFSRPVNTLRQKYSYRNDPASAYPAYSNLTQEFLNYV